MITGGSGFLGRSLTATLKAQGHEVVSLSSKDANLTLQGALAPWDGIRFDRIFHLAAWTQAGDFCLKHPGEQWIINQQINANVLAWWCERQPQAKLICMGTSCSYDPHLELEEENYLRGTPIEDLFTYAMTKRMLYAGLLAIRQQFGLNYLHLVPSTLYGPGYHCHGRQMHFIFDLIRKIVRGKLYGEPVVLWGDGHQCRELVFIDDFINIMLGLARVCSNETINIGAGEEFSIRYFAKLICDKVGFDSNAIRYDTSRYVGAKSKCLVVKKMRQLVPEMPVTILEEGLARTIDWLRENREALLADNGQH